MWSIIEPCLGIICACLPILRPFFNSCFAKLSLLSRKMIPTPSSQSEAGRRHMRIHEPDSPEVLHHKRKPAYIADEVSMPTSSSGTTTTAPHHSSTFNASLLPAELPTLGDLDLQTTGISPNSSTTLSPHAAHNPWTLQFSNPASSTQMPANRVSWPLFRGSDFNRFFPAHLILPLSSPPPSTPPPAPPSSCTPSYRPPRDMVQTSWLSAGSEGEESDQDEDETDL